MLNGNKSYELKIVLTLAVLWGIVGLDRLVVVYLFPILIPKYNLSNAQAGAITSILALTWAISAWIVGNVSDRVGRKKVLIGSTIFFSLMSWVTGITKNFAQLILVRGLLGLGEGGVFSSSVAALAAESTPEKKGFNLGLHQSFFPLLGVAFGAIITTQLAKFFTYQTVFFIAGIPGIIIALILMKFMREPLPASNSDNHMERDKPGIFDALQFRNVRISCLISIIFMTWLFVFSAFAMVYMTSVRNISLEDGGFIMSGWGFGGFVGMILIPTISDYWGRRPTVTVATICAGLSVLGFLYFSNSIIASFTWLFISGAFGFGIAPIFLSLCTTESVPSRLAGSSVGIPTAIGEIFGAVLMPIVAGSLADHYGIKYTMLLAGFIPIIGGLMGLLYRETAPRVIKKKTRSTLTSASRNKKPNKLLINE